MLLRNLLIVSLGLKMGLVFFGSVIHIFGFAYFVVGINCQLVMLQEAPDIFQFIQGLIVKVGYEVWNYLLTYQIECMLNLYYYF